MNRSLVLGVLGVLALASVCWGGAQAGLGASNTPAHTQIDAPAPLPKLLITTVDCEAHEDGTHTFSALAKLDEHDTTVHVLRDLKEETKTSFGGLRSVKQYRGTAVSPADLLSAVDKAPEKHIIFMVHGFHVQPSGMIENWRSIHSLLPDDTLVVPIIWPCNNEGLYRSYFGDRESASKSASALAKFVSSHAFQILLKSQKQVHIITHSMGNRVYRLFAEFLAENSATVAKKKVFRNSFMVAADVDHDVFSLARTRNSSDEGRVISGMSDLVHVLYADSDVALLSALAINGRDRLGRVGIAKSGLAPDIVNFRQYDCSGFNHMADPWMGHSYYKALEASNIFIAAMNV